MKDLHWIQRPTWRWCQWSHGTTTFLEFTMQLALNLPSWESILNQWHRWFWKPNEVTVSALNILGAQRLYWYTLPNQGWFHIFKDKITQSIGNYSVFPKSISYDLRQTYLNISWIQIAIISYQSKLTFFGIKTEMLW